MYIYPSLPPSKKKCLRGVLLFVFTNCFLLHLEQSGKPELCEELKQKIPQVLRQELTDVPFGKGDN